MVDMEWKLDTKKEIESIIKFLTDYKNSGCKGVVLGLSGGKDSTVVAMLAKKVWGENVTALLMPNGEQKDISDSLEIAKQLNLDYKVINIETIYNNLVHVVENQIADVPKNKFNGAVVFERDYIPNCPKITAKAKTNIPPRIRMTILYAVAQTMGYRVIGTGNLSESYIGWCTKWGDCAYDINPIGHLTCTEVIKLGRELAKEFNLDLKFVNKTPDDGLSGKSDEDNFGFTYALLDGLIRKNCTIDFETYDKIENMHKISQHKRELPLKLTREPIETLEEN